MKMSSSFFLPFCDQESFWGAIPRSHSPYFWEIVIIISYINYSKKKWRGCQVLWVDREDLSRIHSVMSDIFVDLHLAKEGENNDLLLIKILVYQEEEKKGGGKSFSCILEIAVN